MSENKTVDLFNTFAGREVATVAQVMHVNTGVIVEIVLNPSDPTIVEMKKTAQENGVTLDIVIPSGAATVNTGFNSKRVTATVLLGKKSYIRDVKIG